MAIVSCSHKVPYDLIFTALLQNSQQKLSPLVVVLNLWVTTPLGMTDLLVGWHLRYPAYQILTLYNQDPSPTLSVQEWSSHQSMDTSLLDRKRAHIYSITHSKARTL